MKSPVPRVALLAGFAALIIYAALTYMIPPPVRQNRPDRIFLWVLLAVAVVDFFIGLYIEGHIAQGKGSKAPAAPQSRAASAIIVSTCFGLSIGMYGFIYWLISGERHWFWPFWALSSLYLVLLSNRLDGLQQAAEDAARRDQDTA